jgi:phi LC3 family holin
MINLEQRMKNKAFWIGIISLVILLLQQLGLFQVADYIPKNYADIINTVFAILSALGIVADTSTSGYSDKVVQDVAVQAINSQEEVKTEASTTMINNEVTENSQTLNDENVQLKVEREQLQAENEQLKSQNQQYVNTINDIQSKAQV